LFVIIVSLLAISRSAQAAAGDLDPSLARGRIVTTPLGGEQTTYDDAVQTDGKIVGQGFYTGGFNSPLDAMTRYNADGSLIRRSGRVASSRRKLSQHG
jgi:hypothetical protein